MKCDRKMFSAHFSPRSDGIWNTIQTLHLCADRTRCHSVFDWFPVQPGTGTYLELGYLQVSIVIVKLRL